jgi:hypothetical protein
MRSGSTAIKCDLGGTRWVKSIHHCLEKAVRLGDALMRFDIDVPVPEDPCGRARPRPGCGGSCVIERSSWLLQESGEPRQWDQAALRSKVDEGRTDKIKLRRPVPVAWVYMTGWASPDGATYFRRDIYNLDKGTTLPPPSTRTESR